MYIIILIQWLTSVVLLDQKYNLYKNIFNDFAKKEQDAQLQSSLKTNPLGVTLYVDII